jgi:branched-chain amino acid transport system permease protein
MPKIKLLVFAVIVVVIALTYAGLAGTWFGRASYAYAQKRPPRSWAFTPRLVTAVMLYSTDLAGLGGALYASLYSLERVRTAPSR